MHPQDRAGFVTGSSLEENFYIANQHHCAVLLNKSTFARDFSHTALQIPCTRTSASCVVEGMVSLASSAELPTRRARISRSLTLISIMNAPKRRSVCIALLLLIRDLCSELSAVVLTGDFDKAVERELPSWRPQWTTPSLID